MMIGFSSWAFGWSIGLKGYPFPVKPLTAESLVARIINYGGQIIQFADNLQATDDELLKASNIARQKGIKIELGIVGTNTDWLENRIRFSSKCGINLLRTLPHSGKDIPSPNQLVSRIRPILPVLSKENIVLAIENHDHYTSDELRFVMDAISHENVGICLDTVNNYGKGESYRETTETLLPYIKNFHYKEFIIKRIPNQTGFTIIGAPVGAGLIDIEYFHQRIPSSINWIIEQWTPWQGNIEETVLLENNWASEGLRLLVNLWA